MRRKFTVLTTTGEVEVVTQSERRYIVVDVSGPYIVKRATTAGRRSRCASRTRPGASSTTRRRRCRMTVDKREATLWVALCKATWRCEQDWDRRLARIPERTAGRLVHHDRRGLRDRHREVAGVPGGDEGSDWTLTACDDHTDSGKLLVDAETERSGMEGPSCGAPARTRAARGDGTQRLDAGGRGEPSLPAARFSESQRVGRGSGLPSGGTRSRGRETRRPARSFCVVPGQRPKIVWTPHAPGANI